MANQTWTKTTVGGVVDTLANPVGSGDGAGTITLTASPIVSNGNTLRIEEGVTIKMDGVTRQITVARNASGNGLLQIVGTEAEPVIITSNAGSPAPSDYRYIEIQNSTVGANPTVEADWLIMEYGDIGIVSGLVGTQPGTATLRNCTFRRIGNGCLQCGARATAGVGTWTATECVFDKCPADQPTSAADLITCISGTAGTTAFMELDHCSILADYSNINTINAIGMSTRGNMIVRNCIIKGTNAHPVQEFRTAEISGTSVMANDWNWLDTDGDGNWVDGPNDVDQDPEYFDEDCSGNNDLRPNFDTGVMTADEFGARIGALDPYNIPEIPPEPPAEEETCETDYQKYTDPTCRPFVCDYNFFTGEYPEDWRRELYDRKSVSQHSLVVCIELPDRGIDPTFEFAPGQPIEIIEQSGDTITVNIGPWVQSMRPIKTERDVTFKEYQGSDVDLVFTDWYGRLDPIIEGSLFYNLRWKGLRVDVGSYICGTEMVLKHGRYFIDDIVRRSEVTVIRLRDWFLETLEQPLRANHSGYLTAKLKNNTGSIVPEIFNIDESIAVIEKVRLVFVDLGREDSDVFEYIGDVTGFQGRGFSGATFTTNDGGVTIPFLAWLPNALLGGPVFAPGDELGFTLSNLNTGNPVEIIYAYLTQHGNLVEGVDVQFDEFFEAEALLPTTAQIKLRFGAPVTLLEACRVAARHGFVTLSTNANGHVVLGGFKPSLALSLTEIQNVAICSSNDLIDAQTKNLDVFNIIRSSYDPRESDEATHSGLVGGNPNRWLTYPTDDLGDDFNRSVLFWEEEFPFDLDLPGFRAGQEGAVIAVLQNYWVFFEGTPTAREQLALSTKLHNLNRDLEDIVRVESSHPEREIWAQVIGYAKAPLSQNVELTVIDVSDIVQPDFSCGYAFCDSGHYTDDCWVVW